MEKLTQDQVRDKVFALVREHFGKDEAFELTEETSFVGGLEADSLDTVELVMKLEEEFEMSITDEEAETLTTIGSAIRHIHKYLELSE